MAYLVSVHAMRNLNVAVHNVRGNTCKSPPQAGVNLGVRPEWSVEDPHCERMRERQVCVGECLTPCRHFYALQLKMRMCVFVCLKNNPSDPQGLCSADKCMSRSGMASEPFTAS